MFASVEGGFLSESNGYIYHMHSDGERGGLEMEHMSRVLDDGRRKSGLQRVDLSDGHPSASIFGEGYETEGTASRRVAGGAPVEGRPPREVSKT